MTHSFDFDNIWASCDHIYAANQALCLELQNTHQVNVNLLLLAIYLDKHQLTQFNQAQWQQFSNAIANLESKILLPYRRLRKLAKNMLNDTEYQEMLKVELMLERKSQALISNQLQQTSAVGNQENTQSYLQLFNLSSCEYEFV